jgi:hypothetical protein
MLADGLRRLAKAQPRTELADLTELLPGLSEAMPEEIKEARRDIARALLPLTGLVLVELEHDYHRNHLLSELWLATNEGLLNWLFKEDWRSKSDFLYCLAEWMLLETETWPVSTQEEFSCWWQCLEDPDLNISAIRLTRLLSMLPVDRFYLDEILAYAALARNQTGHDIGPEYWIVLWRPITKDIPRLHLPNNPVEQFKQRQDIDGTSIKRLWPPLRVDDPDFIQALSEHCISWRTLNVMGSSQNTPLEHLVLMSASFSKWLSTTNADQVLGALHPLFYDGQYWSSENWLQLVGSSVIRSNINVPRSNSLFGLHSLRLRLQPLLQNPSSNQDNLRVQIILASMFPSRQLLNRIAKKLIGVLPDEISPLLLYNIDWWTGLCNTSDRRDASVIPNVNDSQTTQQSLKMLWIDRLHPETLNKLGLKKTDNPSD